MGTDLDVTLLYSMVAAQARRSKTTLTNDPIVGPRSGVVSERNRPIGVFFFFFFFFFGYQHRDRRRTKPLRAFSEMVAV
jgi:hypothetical protein